MVQWSSGPWDTVCSWEQVCTLDSKWEHLFKDYIASGETSSSSILSAPRILVAQCLAPKQSDCRVPVQVNWLAQKEKNCTYLVCVNRYVHVHMYVCLRMCVCRYICVLECIYTHAYVCIYVCMCVYVCLCAYTYLHIQIYVCVYVSACFCVYVCVYFPKDINRFLPNHP